MGLTSRKNLSIIKLVVVTAHVTFQNFLTLPQIRKLTDTKCKRKIKIYGYLRMADRLKSCFTCCNIKMFKTVDKQIKNLNNNNGPPNPKRLKIELKHQ